MPPPSSNALLLERSTSLGKSISELLIAYYIAPPNLARLLVKLNSKYDSKASALWKLVIAPP